MSSTPRKHEKGTGAVDLLEQATVLLRSAPLEALACYYLGSLPFMLGLLWFWADMSRSPAAHLRLSGGALGLALLFIWMKVWQARFCSRLLTHLDGSQQRPSLVSSILIQGGLQPWGFIVLPLAALVTLPLGWCYAFFQNLTALEGPDIRSTLQTARRQALLWPGQNHLLICLLALIGLVLFINIAVSAFLLPRALKTLLGIETIFTRSNLLLLNSTFWATVVVMTHLCIDPLVKTCYLLRCYYGQSLSSGADLRAQLRRLTSRPLLLLLGLSVMASLIAGIPAAGAQPPLPETHLQQRTIQLDHSIEQTIASHRYSWRLPRGTEQLTRQELPGFLRASLDWLQDTARTVTGWVRKLLRWISHKLPKPKPPENSPGWGSGFQGHALPLLYGLLAVLLCTAAIFAWRRLRRPDPLGTEPVTLLTAVEPDLRDESVLADELSEERWSAMARELLAKGELRLGLRALYLSSLVSLSEARLLGIGRSKTNRDYEQELLRFSHAKPALAEAFSSNLRIFEGAWYGLHLPDEGTLRRYLDNHSRIKGELRAQ